MLKDGTFCNDLGSTHLDRALKRSRLVKRLAELGFSAEFSSLEQPPHDPPVFFISAASSSVCLEGWLRDGRLQHFESAPTAWLNELFGYRAGACSGP
jgi:hypothetical protein